jgi:hypothetical protein
VSFAGILAFTAELRATRMAKKWQRIGHIDLSKREAPLRELIAMKAS